MSVEADEGSKAMEVDYMPDEMAKAADHYGVNRQISEFYLGWRAACEAWHKKAQAKAASVRAAEEIAERQLMECKA